MTFLPEWRRASKAGRYERSDVKTASYRLSITLSETHRAYLEEQRQKFGLSYASMIRSLITQRIEGPIPHSQMESVAHVQSESSERSFCKVPDAGNISALNTELKALFARLPCQEQKGT